MSRKLRHAFALLFLSVFLMAAVVYGATVASDDSESYSGGNYTDENGGTGFAAAYAFKNFGGSDAGGEFIASGGSQLAGSQSVALYANSSGSGRAVSRDFSSALSTSTGYRFRFRVKFSLDTNASKTAGFVLCSTATGSKSNWNDGQRLFVGISGNGLWRFDDGALKTVRNEADSADYSAIGGNIYRVVVDFQGDSYWLRIFNETASTQSKIMSGTLGGTGGSQIRSIAFGNGVIGTNQDLIWDDVLLEDNPTALAVSLREVSAAPTMALAAVGAVALAGLGGLAVGAIRRRRR
jgi:hypothetical protein